MSTGTQQTQKLPSIAVVAVHGVGEQEPGASARALADLLLRLRHPNGAPRYTSFAARELRIPARPAVVEPPRPATIADAKKARRSIFTEQSDMLLARLHGGGDPATFSAEHEFMRGQLEAYESAGAPYETVRVEGARLADAATAESAAPDARLHVYEMYWADLSRLGTGSLRIFGEMYQLFFNVANLGRLTVDHARAAYGSPPAWRLFGNLHTWAVRLLTLFIPVGWLTMLATVLGVLVVQAPPRALPWVISVGGGLTVAAATWWAIYRVKALARRALAWLAIPVLGVVAGLLLWNFAAAEAGHALHVQVMVLSTWLLLAGALLDVVWRRYDSVRPGAWVVGMTAYAATLLAGAGIVSYALSSGLEGTLLQHVANLFEIQTAATVATWYLLYALGFTSGVAGLWAARRLPESQPATERARAMRVWGVAQATLAIATWSVLVVTFVLWAAVLKVSAPLLPAANRTAPDALFGFWSAASYVGMFERMLAVTAGAGFPLALFTAGGLAVLLLLALLPAVIHELRAPDSTDQFGQGARAGGWTRDHDALWKRLEHEDVLAERLGRWLSKGYAVVVFSTTVLFVAVFALQPLATLLYWTTGSSLPLVGGALEWLQGQGATYILALGGALTAAAVGVVALRSRFRSLTLGFRPMLDAALDVDNYMREHPRASTPRARIAERYASLMRYLAHWRDEDGEPYHSIVLVTHSQGTVISADMLGFLQRERDPELGLIQELAISANVGALPGSGRRQLFLFTMGSPLRQLYNWAFPHLFGWVHVPEAAWGAPCAATTDAPGADAPGEGRRGSSGRRVVERQSGSTPVAREALGRNDEGHVVVAPAIPDSASPEPSVLGVSRWVNAYRSGDYVGRALWRVDMADCGWMHRAAAANARAVMGQSSPPVVFVSEDGKRSRRELCIGRGAHTHYWDATAATVAIELDLLIASASSVAVAIPPGSGLRRPSPGGYAVMGEG